MGKLGQADFGGGIWRELDAPTGYVYDAENAVVDGADLRLRGGTVTLGPGEAASPWLGVAAGRVAAGPRLVVWNSTDVMVLTPSNDLLGATVGFAQFFEKYARVPVYAGAFVFRIDSLPGVILYGGTTKIDASVATTRTKGSADISTAASFADVEAGHIVHGTSAADSYVVDAVLSTTAAALTATWREATVTDTLDFRQVWPAVPVTSAHAQPYSCLTVAANRLVVGESTRIWMTRINEFRSNENEFHDLGTEVIGLEAMGSNMVLAFGTTGVWAIDNVALDLTDAAGNPQQQLRLITPNVGLWNDSGLASWEGRVVVPAHDDVYLFTPDGGPTVISRGIRSLYRSYVQEGSLRPGVASVFQGHYFLPIIDASGTVHDVLVCRLDQTDARGNLRPAWTRFKDHALVTALAVEAPGEGASPRLAAVAGAELLDLTGTLDPSVATTDADGGTPDLDVTTNDIPTGPGNKNTVTRLKLRYELAGDAVVASFLTGNPGSETVLAPEGPPSDGETSVSWRFVKRTDRIRFRVRTSGGAAKLRLRSLEVFTRDSNRP